LDQGGSFHYYHTDGLGSVNELTDASGNVARTYRYDSFGKISAQSGDLDQPFTFTGREYDTETGLYYYRARYSDPKAGRFVSKDPLGFRGVKQAVRSKSQDSPTPGANLSIPPPSSR